MDCESFIGLWDIYCSWVHSELLLQTDKTYRHSLWGGVQSHWGVWSLVVQREQACLVLEVKGAQPVAYPSLFGMVPMNWPSRETWAVTAVQPNDIYFSHGRMVRRAFAGLPVAPATRMPFLSTVQFPNLPPIPPLPQMPVFTLPPDEYSAPPPPPTPDVHQSPVTEQWLDSMKAAQDLYAKVLTDDMQTTSSINDMEQKEFNDEFNQRQAQNAAMAKNTTDNTLAFSRAINPSKLR